MVHAKHVKKNAMPQPFRAPLGLLLKTLACATILSVAVNPSFAASPGDTIGTNEAARASKAQAAKQEFLRTVAQLGRSEQEDRALLEGLTGIPFRRGQSTPPASWNLKTYYYGWANVEEEIRIPTRVSYSYGIDAEDRYTRVSMLIYLRRHQVCVRFEDLEPVFGQPTNKPWDPGRPPMPRTGEFPVYSAAYRLSSGLGVGFSFSTQECASTVFVQ